MAGVAAFLVATWLAASLLATLGCALTLHLLRRPQPQPEAEPEVLVVVPVRGTAGLPGGLPAFLAGLAAQDWPAFRVVFAIEAADDPAAPLLAAALPGRSVLVVAGPAERRGQKVHQLLAALAALRPGDAALVTLDADTLPPPGLLRALLRPILTGQGEVSTGYRWTLAAPGAGLAARLLAMIDQGIATLPRCRRCNLAWGGATAISAAALPRLDLPRLWDRALSDDLTLSQAVRAAGMILYAPLTVRPPGPVSGGLGATFGFAARQYRLVRLHAPLAWGIAGTAALLPLAGGVAALGLGTWSALGAALTMQAVRARLRAGIAAQVLPHEAAARLPGWRPWLTPLAAGLNAAAWLASATGREITWAGRRYTLDGEGRVTSLTLG